MMVVFYFWMLCLNFVSQPVAEPQKFQKWIQLQLGPPGRWPPLVQAIALLAGVTALWAACHPLLTWIGALVRLRSPAHLIEQGLLLTLSLLLTLKFLIPAFLFAHLVHSYIYLGAHPIWEYVGMTSRRFLAPLARVPLRAGRVDFAPLVGIVLILLLLHALPNAVLSVATRSGAHPGGGWTLWPQ
jgi:uncharacterized protein YggT (Ycf19 family)